MSSSTPEAALALMQAGRLAEAEAAARSALSTSPDDPNALHYLGVILWQSGRRDEGLPFHDRSLSLAPRHVGFLNNRAFVLAEAGRIEDAERDLRRALQIEPRFVAALCHLGSLMRQTGRLEEATAAFRRALALDARSVDAHVGLGNVLRLRGDNPGARSAFAAALAIDPRHPAADYNLANLLYDAGDARAAEAGYRAVLERDAGHGLALNNLGVLLRRTGRAEESFALFERAVAAMPRNADALNNLGLALQDAGRTEDAVARFAAAVEADPRSALALNSWGNALKDRGDLEGAAALFDRALSIAPNFAEALNNRGNVALEEGDLVAARRLCEQALAEKPGFVDAQFSLAQRALRARDYAAGWDLYERRFATTPPMATWQAPPLPAFEREDLDCGLAVAVWREQGVGDQLLFSTLLPELAAAGARPVVELDARLVPLYRRNFPALAFVTPGESAAAFAACDRHLPLGSLPRLFRREESAFAAQPRPLLHADPARVAAVRERLGGGRWIAVSWRSFQGRGRRYLEERKSMPVEALAQLSERAGVKLLDLQYGDVALDRAQFEAAHPGVLTQLEGLDLYNDFEGLLAAIEACVAVVTVSNVTAHLAGVAGRRAFVLFPNARAPFHYWSATDGAPSPWYPQVRSVTGSASEGWVSLVEKAARALAV